MLKKLRARLRGKSYWSVRYLDGRVVNEWDEDWSHLDTKGISSVTLHCPDGQKAVLGNTVEDIGGRVFQFKVGELRAGESRSTLAQVIGLVDDFEGDCQCAAWEYGSGLKTFRDNVYAMSFHNVGQLAMGPMRLSLG